MSQQRIVAALGRNAVGKSFPEQKAAVQRAAGVIADLIEARYQVVVTHSNGVQVGMIHTAMNEFALHHKDYTGAPMSVCSAMSQGYIGYDLQNSIRTELLNRGIYKTVVSLITQVKVDPFDAAFNHPVKTIGRLLTEEEAKAEEAKGNFTLKEDGGYRRLIASPAPIEIYELEAIRTLSDSGAVVIAAGGGGIPVLEQGTVLKGAGAVIEKDQTAAKLAHELDADILLFLSEHDGLSIEEKGEEKFYPSLTSADAFRLLENAELGEASIRPKLSSALQFVLNGENRRSVIASPSHALQALQGKAGTTLIK